jgi:hypothetical protein
VHGAIGEKARNGGAPPRQRNNQSSIILARTFRIVKHILGQKVKPEKIARAGDADPGSLSKRRRRRDFALHNI